MLNIDLGDGIQVMETRWRDASENEKRSRARFAQNAMKPSEVVPEWDKAKSLLGSPGETLEFLERAMSRFGVPLEKKKSLQFAHVHALQGSLKEKIEQRGLKGSLKLATQEPVPSATRSKTWRAKSGQSRSKPSSATGKSKSKWSGSRSRAARSSSPSASKSSRSSASRTRRSTASRKPGSARSKPKTSARSRTARSYGKRK